MTDSDDKTPPGRTWGAPEQWGKTSDEWPTQAELDKTPPAVEPTTRPAAVMAFGPEDQRFRIVASMVASLIRHMAPEHRGLFCQLAMDLANAEPDRLERASYRAGDAKAGDEIFKKLTALIGAAQ